jgi:hypothetical protein
MRRGHAKPGRAARQETAADHHWSAGAQLVRVSREAPNLTPREGGSFRAGKTGPHKLLTVVLAVS